VLTHCSANTADGLHPRSKLCMAGFCSIPESSWSSCSLCSGRWCRWVGYSGVGCTRLSCLCMVGSIINVGLVGCVAAGVGYSEFVLVIVCSGLLTHVDCYSDLRIRAGYSD
jgi:hypothetical protein